MDSNKLSGIVVYTIHENDSLRDALREGIKNAKNFKTKPLDESTYGIYIKGRLPDAIFKELETICENAKKESKLGFSNSDLVCLYYLAYSEESKKESYIKQKYVITPQKQN